MKRRGFQVDGFLTIRKGDEPAGYDLFDIRNERLIPFIRPEGKKEWQRTGAYYPRFFIPRGLAEAERMILDGTKSDLCIVDEVGPLEMRGEGFRPALDRAFSLQKKRFLLVARKKILTDLVAKLSGKKVTVLDMKDRGRLLRSIEEIMKRTEKS